MLVSVWFSRSHIEFSYFLRIKEMYFPYLCVGEMDNDSPIVDESAILLPTTAGISSNNNATIASPIQCISTTIVSSQPGTSNNLLPHNQQLPASPYNIEPTAVSTDDQPQTLPQFNANLTNTILIISETPNSNTIRHQTQSMQTFDVILPQHYTEPGAVASPDPSQSSEIISPADEMFESNARHNLSLPLAISLGSASSSATSSPVDHPYGYVTHGSIDMDMLPSLEQSRPTALERTLLDDVQFDFQFRMDDLYRASPSNDSGYSPSQSTISSHTPQYLANAPATTSPSRESPLYMQSMTIDRLPSFSPTLAASINTTADSPMHLLGYSETASVYSVDSGHPCDSPTQHAASPFSSTSPIPQNSSDSPHTPFLHSDDSAMAKSPSVGLSSPTSSTSTHGTPKPSMTSNHTDDDDISLDIDSLLIFKNAQSLHAHRMRSPPLDEFHDVSSVSFDSYEKLLNANELPLKLPQVTDADLKQALQPTSCGGSIEFVNARCTKSIKLVQPASVKKHKEKKARKPKTPRPRTKTVPLGRKKMNAKAIQATEFIDLTKEQEPVARPQDNLNAHRPDAVQTVATAEAVKTPAGPRIATPVVKTVKPIISIIPIRPAAKAPAPTQPTSGEHAKFMMDLQRLTKCNAMSIEPISVPVNAKSDIKRNITMAPNRLEISVVSVAIKDILMPNHSDRITEAPAVGEEATANIRPKPTESAASKEAPKSCTAVVPNEKLRPVGKVIPNEKPKTGVEVAPIEIAKPIEHVTPVDIATPPIEDVTPPLDPPQSKAPATQSKARSEPPTEAYQPREALKIRLKRVSYYQNELAEPAVKLRKIRKSKTRLHRASVDTAQTEFHEAISIDDNSSRTPPASPTHHHQQQITATSAAPFPSSTTSPPTIELGSIQSTTSMDRPQTPSSTSSHNSGKLQLLCDRMRKCSVILQRIDDVMASGKAEDIAYTQVHNNNHKITITLPKQYAISTDDAAGATTNDRRIEEMCQLVCEICGWKYCTVTDVFEHYRREHQMSGYLRCCTKKFRSREALLEHINSHDDVEPRRYR